MLFTNLRGVSALNSQHNQQGEMLMQEQMSGSAYVTGSKSKQQQAW